MKKEFNQIKPIAWERIIETQLKTIKKKIILERISEFISITKLIKKS